MEILRIKNDINGNSRFVVHFLALITDSPLPINEKYNAALFLARKIGGKKFHNKQFGGGISFQAYNAQELQQRITDFVNRNSLIISI